MTKKEIKELERIANSSKKKTEKNEFERINKKFDKKFKNIVWVCNGGI